MKGLHQIKITMTTIIINYLYINNVDDDTFLMKDQYLYAVCARNVQYVSTLANLVSDKRVNITRIFRRDDHREAAVNASGVVAR